MHLINCTGNALRNGCFQQLCLRNADVQKATADLFMGDRQAILLPGPASRMLKLCSYKRYHAQEGAVLWREGLTVGLTLCQEPESCFSSFPYPVTEFCWLSLLHVRPTVLCISTATSNRLPPGLSSYQLDSLLSFYPQTLLPDKWFF